MMTSAVTNILIVLLAVLLLLCVFWLILRQEMTHRYIISREEEKQNRFAIFSHRLRTPLTSIKWYIEMLMSGDAGSQKISQIELMHKIENGVTDAIDQLNEYLEFSRENFDRLIAESEAVDVLSSLRNVLQSLNPYISEKGHTVSINSEVDHAIVMIDPLLLFSLLDVLISNAVFYTPNSGKVKISVSQKSDMVTIAIQDSGIGIDDSEKKKVFNKFFRGQNASRYHVKGSGLGLYFAHRIVQTLGGKITFESKEGKGTTFYVSLPTA